MKTIKEAKEYIVENMLAGAICPCCGQLAKVYARKLNKGMCEVLKILNEKTEKRRIGFAPNDDVWIHVSNELAELKINATNKEYPKLRFWGFLEMGTAGYWRVTPKGDEFVRGIITAPSAIYLYNGEFKGFVLPKRVFFKDIYEGE